MVYKNNFGSEKKFQKNFAANKFLVWKKSWVQKNIGFKNFWSKEIVGPKIFEPK